MKSKQALIILFTALAFLAGARGARAGEWVTGTAKTAAGTRDYKLWMPAGKAKSEPLPLVMMLHGCMQGPDDLAAISGMNQVADQNGFLVVYPEQTKEANALKCWNWFAAKDQSRDAGEPALLVAVVKQVQTTNRVDARRVYVAGISAGAAMAVVMAVTYPDIFRAVGSVAGLEYQAATTVEAGLEAMKKGGPDPMVQGEIAFKIMTGHLSNLIDRRLPVIVFQGATDPYVNPLNADQLIAQWATINDLLDDGKPNASVKREPASTAAGEVAGGHKFTRAIYRDRDGRTLMEKWTVEGMGHAWSGSPTALPFADPKGPNASAEMWRFFVESSAAQRK
jgi:poly(hydroxyalkanoate) depolymerase family esterase